MIGSNPVRRCDLRSAKRYPIEQEVSVSVLGKRLVRGRGTTVNVSSSGLLFTHDCPLEAGDSVELAMSWPAKLDQTCPIKLVMSGQVVRSDARQAAVSVKRYEFRLQGGSLEHVPSASREIRETVRRRKRRSVS